jgi:FtsP/CotA-like multicopper oxidase with cupredoxin domain
LSPREPASLDIHWRVICVAKRIGILGVTAMVMSCGDNSPPAPPELDLVPITDLNPADDVVEVNLIAAPGETRFVADGAAQIWGYADGAREPLTPIVPGPLIEAHLGDTVIVHFTNLLPEDTTIHWHGIRVPNGSDGTHVTQAHVPPGGTFDYQFVANDAGTFWYHPHLHSDVQIERGLAGALIVRGGIDVPADADRVFVLDDVKLESNGTLSETTDATDLMLGRQGNVILANGSSGGRIEVKNGARERWRFINAANGRYFNVRLPDRRLTVIGWDGGLLAEPYQADSVLIAPGERYEVLVELSGAPGDIIPIETIYYFRAHGLPFAAPEPVFTVRIGSDAATPAPLPSSWASFTDVPIDSGTPVRAFMLEEQEPTVEGEEPRFFINGASFPDVPPIAGTSGAVEIWELENHAEMDHPIHLHGMSFQVLEMEGAPPLGRAWKDTVNVKSHERVRLAVRFGAPGRWMYHCHILEHVERGMMGELVLSEAR